MVGCSDGGFGPENPVTFEQLCCVIARPARLMVRAPRHPPARAAGPHAVRAGPLVARPRSVLPV